MVCCYTWKYLFIFIIVWLLHNDVIATQITLKPSNKRQPRKSLLDKNSNNNLNVKNVKGGNPNPVGASVCTSLKIDQLFRKKDFVDKKLESQYRVVENNHKLTSQDKEHRLKIINIIRREMNESVSSIYGSLDILKSLLQGDHKSVIKLKETSKQRLTQLQTSMLSAEDVYNILTEAEKEEETATKQDDAKSAGRNSKNILKKFMNELLGDISQAADKLESSLDDDAFKNGMQSKNEFSVETVIKVGGEESTGEDNEGIVMLVDSESNHFVLSKPKDGTTTHVDHNLLKEIIYLTMVSFLLVLLCNYLNIPSLFACIMTGIVLGPSGGNHLTSVVQIETLGEFGVFFILFSVGLEFSPEKLRKVLKQALISVTGLFSSLLLIGLFWGTMFGFSSGQSIFVTFCLAFSSTPLITKLMKSYKPLKDHITHDDDSGDDYIHLLMAMLVIEDGLIGFLMALLPIMAGHSNEKSHSFARSPSASLHSMFHGALGGPAEEIFFTAFELIFGMAGVLFISYVVSKYVANKFFRSLHALSSSESFVLGIISSIFLMLTITERCGISMELGCFICGCIMGSMGDQVTERVMAIVEPFKDFFGSLFFASIGFHIFPAFMFSELAIFIPITTLIIFTKFIVARCVFHYALPVINSSNKWTIATGLSQMSEFSFLLGSRARRFGLIGREVYLMILSVTTLSFVFSPIIWRIIHSSVAQNLLRLNVRGVFKKVLRF